MRLILLTEVTKPDSVSGVGSGRLRSICQDVSNHTRCAGFYEGENDEVRLVPLSVEPAVQLLKGGAKHGA